ncbi:Collagen-like protein 4 [Fusarium oxysporum f. sp. cubense]|uniref:Collagen-like protein 4 n=1 Tax=Fusarium oxysporum f. sp. cubense TaxID=61366 RepID=A0A559LBH4_FUSOC|nr:Collagen-like protein 4 [Fusarium oxysporum f. sp. cubense]
MAAAAVQTYTPASYDHRAVDAMTDVDVAAQRLQELNGLDHMKSCIRDVFMKHGVDKVFGVGLLHRHYDVAPNEKIIELGPVSSPWVVGDDEVVTGGSVLPHTWRVFDGELKPTEFKFVPQRDLSNVDRPVFPAAFVKELIGVLQETGLDEVLGVSLYEAGDPDNETMEVTYGRSSIVIPSTGLIGSKVIGPQGFDAFQAAWTFSKKEGEDVVAHHGICAAMGVDNGVTARHGICAAKAAEGGVTARHGICAAKMNDGVKALHGICAAKAENGFEARHGICAAKASDGVNSRHGICAAKSAEDGLKAHHGICAAKASTDGVTSRHGICAAKSADDGMTARHGICAAKADDGFTARHGICAAKASEDGINARHGICAAKAADEGMTARHGICAAKSAEGMKAYHGICAAKSIEDGVKAHHGICAARTAEDGIKAKHGICAAKAANEGMTARHGICAARLANWDGMKV